MLFLKAYNEWVYISGYKRKKSTVFQCSFCSP